MAQQVLAGRERAATQIRLVLARVYGVDGMATAGHWHVLPCLTPEGTLGVVDISRGTAWDTGVEADPGVEDLGLADHVYAAANMPDGGGPAAFDGEVVQAQGTAVVDGRIVPPSMPDGWKQILLPTWHGYRGDGRSKVPVELYKPETWIRPKLAAAGLMTCYGRPGKPEDGRYLTSALWHESAWPHGVPEWVEGSSVTVLDTVAGALGMTIIATRHVESLPKLRWPRGTDEEELERLRPFVEVWREKTAAGLRKAARAARAQKMGEELSLLEEAVACVERGERLGPEMARELRSKIAFRGDWAFAGLYDPVFWAEDLDRALEAIGRRSPWEAACALGPWAPVVLADVWPLKP